MRKFMQYGAVVAGIAAATWALTIPAAILGVAWGLGQRVDDLSQPNGIGACILGLLVGVFAAPVIGVIAGVSAPSFRVGVFVILWLLTGAGTGAIVYVVTAAGAAC